MHDAPLAACTAQPRLPEKQRAEVRVPQCWQSLVMAVASHAFEALTIAWEIFAYNAPADSAPPMTLMGIFATWTLWTVNKNEDGFMAVDDANLMALKVLTGLTWFFWAFGVAGVIKNKGKSPAMN